MSSPTAPAREGASWRFLVGSTLLLLVGALARFIPWFEVLHNGHAALVPTDSHYYIRFALRQIAHFPRFDTFDPYVNSPTGAHIYWPPLHTLLVAAMILLCGRGDPEFGAALVDPTLGTIELAILGLIAFRLYGKGVALLTLAFYALLPAAVNYSQVGSADHHVHEPFFMALICLLLGRALSEQSARLATITGVATGLARLFTPIAPMMVVMAAASCFAAVVLDRNQNRVRLFMRVGGAVAAVLAPSVLLFGDARSFQYESLSWFQPLFALSLFAAVAAVAQIAVGDRRAWRMLVASAAFAAPLLPDLLRAASHMARHDPLLAVADESAPLSFEAAKSGFSAALLIVPISLIGAVKRFRKADFSMLPAIVSVALLIPSAIQQMRFTMILSGPVAILMAIGLPEALAGFPMETFIRRTVTVLACGNFWFGATAVHGDVGAATAMFRPTLGWMRAHLPSASSDGPMGDAKAEYGIVANPFLGHLILLWADLPAVSTPFSQAQVHIDGNERVARVFSAYNEDDAYTAMIVTEGKYLLVSAVMDPLGHPEIDTQRTYVRHLFDSASEGALDSGHFRLIHRSAEQSTRVANRSSLGLYEAVPGAVIAGSGAPGTNVTARLTLTDNLGNPRTYSRASKVDPSGHFAVRVAYPTEVSRHLSVMQPSSYEVTVGAIAVRLQVPAEAVQKGRTITIQSTP